jgi:electron transport complex protein RnfG
MATPVNDTAARRSMRAAAILALVAALAFGLVALVHESTRDEIAAAERARSLARFDAVLGGTQYENDLLADVVTVRDAELLGTTAAVPVYRARRQGRIVAIVLAPVAPGGYSGPIHLLVGIERDGRVLGVRVTEHRETPGLGDAIETRKSRWILGFDGKGLRDPPAARWRVRKDGGEFDQFTGATITPRAVVAAVAGALLYFERHREALLEDAATMPP